MSGGTPLSGLRLLEFAGIGPGPFAAMLLADMGADVLTIARPGNGKRDPRRFQARGRPVVEIDIKSDQGRVQALELIARSDMLIEGFRPGVMERLGIGPAEAQARNPRLVYGRITGWGQDGPLAQTAGHDINYIAITGALHAIRGGDGAPVAPLNLLGDYAGGSLYLVAGMLAALLERTRSGLGQVVDSAIVDGTLSLLTPTLALKARGQGEGTPGTNLLDGGAFFYQTYLCADGEWLAIGAAEPHFYRLFLQLGEIEDGDFELQYDSARWPELRTKLSQIIQRRTRAEWLACFEGSDACVSPVMSLDEAVGHPHLAARGAFIEHEDYLHPAPAPRLSRTPLVIPASAPLEPISVAQALEHWLESGATCE